MRPTVACILALCVALVAVQPGDARTVSIAVDAPWSQHPAAYILELAEFTADQGSDVYWRYLDALCTSHGAAIDAVASPKQCPFLGMGAFEAPVAHAAAYSAAAALVSAPMHPLMETIVGVGFYGPAVQVRACLHASGCCRTSCLKPSISRPFTSLYLQFHTSLAEPYGAACPGDAAFAVTYPADRVVCAADAATALTAAQLAAAATVGSEGRRDMGDIDAASLKWDHRYHPAAATAAEKSASEGASESERPKVVVYGVPGSKAFCTLHAAAKALADAGAARYAARPAVPPAAPPAAPPSAAPAAAPTTPIGAYSLSHAAPSLRP